MKAHYMEQRSEEWHQIRVGKLTASQIGRAFALTKQGWSAKRADLKMQIVCERLTGYCDPSPPMSPPMQWGVQQEAEAIAAYERHCHAPVFRVGFLESDDGLCGCSPDGIVEIDG
jgi:hypothetical protein